MKELVHGQDLPGGHMLWGRDYASVAVLFVLERDGAQQLARSQLFGGSVRVQLWSCELASQLPCSGRSPLPLLPIQSK